MKYNNNQRSNNRNTNRQPRQPRVKVTPVNASAVFLTFEDAIAALRSAHPVINTFFSGLGEDATYDEYVGYVAEKVADAVPQLLAKRNIHTQYSISGTNVFIRTEDNLAFGWNVTYKVEDGHASITSVKAMITMFDEFTDLKEELADLAWNLEERKSRRAAN